MTDSPKPFHIVFLLFDGITQLDFTGPAQQGYWRANARPAIGPIPVCSRNSVQRMKKREWSKRAMSSRPAG